MASAESSDGAARIPGRAKADATETVGDATPGSGGPPQDIAPASAIGRYVVLDLLGVGGMGVVCTAYDPKLDRKVALKLLRERADKHETQATQGQARLLREAQALAKLSHPNIITVHDVDTFDGQLYMAMEFVEGQTLKEWATEKKRAWREIVDVYIDAGRGLAAAHGAGIIHRDFKPANVLMGNDGRVRVVDFGLAKGKEDRVDELEDEVERTTGSATNLPTDSGIIDMLRSVTDTELTQIGRSVGTPAYMAPEQHMGFGVGPHTDQFSFCVSLFEGLYGHSPFAGKTVEEKFQNIVEGNVREPAKDAQVPQWVHRVLLRGLKSQSQDRFPSMDALLVELSKDPAKRRRRIAAGAGIVAVAGFGAFGAMQVTDTSNVCHGAEERLVGVWDEDRKAAMNAAFLATDKPYAADAWSRVEASVDEWAASWTASHLEVCEATQVRGEQSDTLLDVRMSCLERRLDDVSALMEIFADADAKVVEAAAGAAANITDPSACITAEQAPRNTRCPRNRRRARPSRTSSAASAGSMRCASRGATRAPASWRRRPPPMRPPCRTSPTLAEALLAQAEARQEGKDLELARESFVSAIRASSAAARPGPRGLGLDPDALSRGAQAGQTRPRPGLRARRGRRPDARRKQAEPTLCPRNQHGEHPVRAR